MQRPALLLLPLVLFSWILLAGNKKDDVPQSSLSFTVVRDENGKPVRNASVVLHPVGKNGKQKKTGFELKTDPDGKTHFDGVPYGPWLVQVIAPGFQTFGDSFNIAQPNQEITIRLKPPQGQYSIYDKHDGAPSTPPPAPQP